MSDPKEFKPEDLAAAKAQASAALGGQVPDSAGMAQAVTGAAPNEVDVAALKQAIVGMQAQIQQLQAEKASQHAPAVVESAQALADAVNRHVAGETGHPELQRLADDVVDAAKNAASSGNGDIVTQLSGKIADSLAEINPGPGDHHWFRQAENWAKVHLPRAAAHLDAPRASATPALTSQQGSVPVVAGSVTG